jgi:hypothetical protein
MRAVELAFPDSVARPGAATPVVVVLPAEQASQGIERNDAVRVDGKCRTGHGSDEVPDAEALGLGLWRERPHTAANASEPNPAGLGNRDTDHERARRCRPNSGLECPSSPPAHGRKARSTTVVAHVGETWDSVLASERCEAIAGNSSRRLNAPSRRRHAELLGHRIRVIFATRPGATRGDRQRTRHE